MLFEEGLSIDVNRNFHSLRKGRKFFKRDGEKREGMRGEWRQGRGKISLLGNKWLCMRSCKTVVDVAFGLIL